MSKSCKVQNSPEPFDIEVKRFYIPGVVITADCPRCGTKCLMDLDGDYLSYPKANEPFEISLTCPKCEEDENLKWDEMSFQVKVKLNVTLEPA